MCMENEIELSQQRAMIYLPENAVEVTIICKVYEDGELIEVSNQLRLSEIRSAFEDAEDNYIADDDKFVITEKGKEWLEQHKDDYDDISPEQWCDQRDDEKFEG